MSTTKRTQQEIIERIASASKEGDMFGWETTDLIYFLTFENAGPHLKEGTTPEEWANVQQSDPEDRIRDYMPFAWKKANDRRGISAARSLCHMAAWLWLDGKDELAGRLHEYTHYGKPHLVAICEMYGIDWCALDDNEWLSDEDETPITADQALGRGGAQ